MTDRVSVALPRKALAGSAAGKGIEALTLVALVLLVPRALGPADYGGFAVALAGAGAVATGHVAIAAGAALAITYAMLQTMLVALPGAARAYARDARAAEAALRRTALWCAAAALPLCIVVALAAEPLLAAALGEGFRGAAGALRIALAAAALAPLWALANQLAVLRDLPGAVLAGSAAGASSFAGVALAAVPSHGADGAAAAMLAGVAATTAATFAVLHTRRA